LEIAAVKSAAGVGVVRFSMPLAQPIVTEEPVINIPSRVREVVHKER
jgi:hypothetical protein